MKKFSLKFSFVFSLAIFTALFLSGFFTSCAADAESTKLVVNLGSNSRSALNASESNTAYYIVLVENDSESIEKRGDKGSVVVFEEIPVGTYNVKISAYDANDNLLASSTQTADVLQNKVCEVALSLKSGFRTNNDIWLWNVAGSSPNYMLKRFPVFNKNTELGFFTVENYSSYMGYDIVNSVSSMSPYFYSWAEDKEGRIFYISTDWQDHLQVGIRYKKDGSYYTNKSSEQFQNNFVGSTNWGSFIDPLCYDISDDTIIAASIEEDGENYQVNFTKYKTKEIESNGSVDVNVNEKGTIKVSGITEFTSPSGLACAKKGNKYYFSIYDNREGSEKCVLYRCHVTEVDEEDGNGVAVIDGQISMEDIGLAGAFIDIAVLDDGSLYALAFQKASRIDAMDTGEYKGTDGNMINSLSLPAFSNEQNWIYYSRGAIVKFNDSEAGFSLDFSKGWTNLREMRASGDKEAALEWAGQQENAYPKIYGEETLKATYEPDRLIAAFPSADERDSAFFGPMKIVAIKPKELYIVDSGVSIKLADWDAKKTGNYFGHDRVMKFDLENFGLSCVKDETVPYFKPSSINGSSLFEKNNRLTNFLNTGEISISGEWGFGKTVYNDYDNSKVYIGPVFEE